MNLTPPSKDIHWLTGLRWKTQQSVIYKRPTLLTETNIALEWKCGRRFDKLMAPVNRKE
jgi:hypothetical protein